jgi:gliding motility-associated-like protein
VNIEVGSVPFAQATNYVFGCYGSDIAFFAAGGSFYEWTGPNGFHSMLQGPVLPKVDFSNTGMYIVKVTTNGGCSAYDTTNLVVYPAPVASVASAQLFLCEDDSVELLASGSVNYRWTPSSGLSNDTIANPFAKPKETTIYTVRVYNAYTCYDTANVKVVVWKKAVANAGPDKFTTKKKPVVLEGQPSGTNITYSWSPPTYLDNPLNERPKASPPITTSYTLTVTSNNGCGSDTDEVKVEVLVKMYIPSAFTPNSDGLNDLWQVFTIEDYPNATVQVFNRWGQRVYYSKGADYKPWDGTFNGLPVATGTYVYVVDLGNKSKVLKGTVTVVR